MDTRYSLLFGTCWRNGEWHGEGLPLAFARLGRVWVRLSSLIFISAFFGTAISGAWIIIILITEFSFSLL